ncbi:MAG TPA: tail fiber domain-containing protein, partial [Candidatus Moranbacteria bacterium]|nr:tail fiber domain-containing protein [Candidatus Moranbacteria bacterium]
MKINFQNKIITFIFALVVALEGASLLFDFSLAQIVPLATPRKIDISAHIINNENREISNGEYEIRFAVYSINRETVDPYPSNTDARLWEETQTVFIKDGILRAYLGTVSPLPTGLNFSSGEYYLGIRIGQDSEMVPRKKIGAVPLAIDALSIGGATVGTAEGNLIKLGTGGKVDISMLPTGKSGKKLVLANDPRLEESEAEIEISGSYSYIDASGSELTLNAINLTSDVTGILGIANGGTGLSSYAAGDMTYYSSGNSFSKISIGNVGEVLTIVGGVPSWQPSTSGISGTGVVGHITYWSGTSAITYDSNGSFYWDSTNNRLGIGTTNPVQKLDVSGKIALNGTTVAYLPTNVTGTLVLGNGGTNLLSGANYNTFVGLNSGSANTTGNNNIAVGYNSLYSNIDGTLNSALGAYSLYSNTAGRFNSTTGIYSLYSNTTGNYNSAVGGNSLYFNTTGNYNSALGMNSLIANTTGYQNSAMGAYSGQLTTGGGANATSNNSVYLGYDTRALADGDTNEIVIGASAIGVGSNSAVLGNDSITKTILKGNVGIGTTNPVQKLDVSGKIALNGTTVAYLPTNVTGTLVLGNGGTNLLSGANYNTFVGLNSGSANTTGNNNIAVGYNSLYSNTTGNSNSAAGMESLYSNTTGYSNAAFGMSSLYSNSTGYYNAAFGKGSLHYNTTGNFNSAFGAESLQSNNTGYENSAFGFYSLGSNTTGYQNSAFGSESLYSNSTGYDNAAFGKGSLFNNTTGSYNASFGQNSLYSNNDGYENSAIGSNALYSNTTGYYNSAIGSYALFYNTEGYENIAFGTDAGSYISDGSSPNETSSDSVYLGYNTMALASGDTNEIVIGASATGIGSNTVTLGNNSIITTVLKGNVGIGTTAPNYLLDVQGGYANASSGLCINGDCITSWSDGGVGQTYTAGNDLDLTGAQFDIESQLDYVSVINRTSADLTLQTTTSGNIILNPIGNVGIGTTNPTAKLQIFGTANTFRQSYDGTYYTDFSTGNSGNLTINPYGDSVIFGATSNPIALLPAENNTAGYTVGSSSYRWKSGYFVDGIVTGTSSTTYGESGITSTYAGDYYISSASNQNIILSTSGTGRVGVGTTDPQYPLDVQGGYANMVTGICLDGDCITSWSDGGVGQIYTAGNDLNLTGSQFDIESQLDYVSTINRTSSDLTLQTTTSGNIILNPTGNVGIGTTNPISLLTVEGVTSLKEITAPSNTTDYGKIYVKTSDSKLYFQDDSGTEFDLTAGGTGSSKWTDGGTTTYLTSSDNVGIGTTNATFKLAVAGDLGPDTDVAYSLGSAEKRWEDIYLGPGSVHMYNFYTDSTNYEQGYIGYEGVPETNATLDFDTADEATFSQEDLAYSTTVTPSATTGEITLTLGSGNWNDNAKVKKGMRVVGNGGIAEISADPAAQTTITATVTDDFTNTDAIASGSWNLYGTNFANNLARISSYTQYATWNPSDKNAAITLSNGDLTATSANGLHKSVRATIGKSSGKWYWEYTAGAIASGGYSYLGVGTTAALLTTYVGNDAEGYSYCPQGNTWHGAVSTSGVSTFVQNDVIGVAVDLDEDKVWWSKNGTWQASGDPETGANGRYTGLTGTFYPMVGLYTTGNSVTANFGDSAFSYTPPTGFYSGMYANSYTSSSYYTIATTDSSQLDSSDWSAISTVDLTNTLYSQTINYTISFDDRTTWKIYDATSGDTGWRPIARNNSGTWQYNSNSTAGATDITWTDATTNNQESAISEAQSVSTNQMTGTELEAVTQANWENTGGFSTTQTTLDFAMSFNTADTEVTPTLDQITVNYQGGPTTGIFTIGSKAQGSGTIRDVQIKSGDNNQIYLASSGNVGIGTQAPAGLFDVNHLFTVLSSGNVGVGTTSPSGLFDVSGFLTVLSSGNVGVGTTNPFGLLDVNSKLTVLSGGNVGIGTTNPGYNLDILSSGTGVTQMFRIQNGIAAANGSGAEMLFGANRTTGGMSNIAGIKGIISDITSGSYDGSLMFSTAYNNSLTEKMAITNAGFVGVGITVPTGYFHVQVPTNMFSSSQHAFKFVNTNSGTSSYNAGMLIQGGGNSATVPELEIRDHSGNTDFWIGGTGNVGIGISAPQKVLDVYGAKNSINFRITSAPWTVAGEFVGLEFVNSSGGYSSAGQIRSISETGANYAAGMVFLTNPGGTVATVPTEKMRINNAGNVGIGTSGPTAFLHIASATDRNMFMIEDNGINDTTPFVVKSDGNVGIGIATPGKTLDVFGAKNSVNFRITSAAWSTVGDYTGLEFVNNASGFSVAGQILSMADSGPSYASAMAFYTNPGGTVGTVPLERMRINTLGNVGIGTTNPGTKLAVAGGLSVGTTSPTSTYLRTLAPDGGAIFEGSMGIGTTNPGSLLDIEGSTGAVLTLGSTTTDGVARNRIFFSNNERAVFHGDDHTDQIFSFKSLFSNARTNDAYIRVHGSVADSWDNYISMGHDGTNGKIFTDAGHILIDPASGSNIGIGTSTPSSMFHISSTAAQDLFRVDDNGSGDFSPFIIDANGNVGVGVTNPTARFSISGTDNPEGQPFLQIKTGLVTAGPDIQFTAQGLLASEINMYFNMDSDNTGGGNFYFNRGSDTSSATNLMTINYDGNVGIGISDPGQKLEIAGNAYFRQSSTTAGIFMRTDATDTFPVNTTDAYIIRSATSAGSYPFNAFGNLILQPTTSTARDIVFATREDDTNTNIRMVIKGSGSVGIGTTNPGSYALSINGSGYLNDTAWNYSSDRRLKDDITPITYGLETITQLNPVSFVYKSTPDKLQLGFIAQEVREIIPEMIGKRPDGMLTLKTDLLIPILTKAFQEQHQEVTSIKGQV